jgi:hypothetical protein
VRVAYGTRLARRRAAAEIVYGSAPPGALCLRGSQQVLELGGADTIELLHLTKLV